MHQRLKHKYMRLVKPSQKVSR